MAGEAARVAVERSGSCRDTKLILLRQGYGATGTRKSGIERGAVWNCGNAVTSDQQCEATA